MGDRRLIEPRLTGGFKHGRLIVLRSAETPKGLDAQSPAVLAAVAKIRERAEADTSPETLGALGVTYLVSGDIGAAVKALESATAQDPDNPRLLSDLAAAYLVRAARLDEPADIPKALEYAERAIALKDASGRSLVQPRPRPRATAPRRRRPQGLGRLPRARLLLWLGRRGPPAPRGPAQGAPILGRRGQRPRPRRPPGGSAAVDRLADESPSLLRAYFEDELLPAWAEAHLVGHPDEKLHREHARLIGEALHEDDRRRDGEGRAAARTRGCPPATATSQDPLRSQALGYRAFREAKRIYDLQQTSCSQFRGALVTSRRRQPVRSLGPPPGRDRVPLSLGAAGGPRRAGASWSARRDRAATSSSWAAFAGSKGSFTSTRAS